MHAPGTAARGFLIKDVTRINGQWVEDLEEIIGKVASQNLKQGMVSIYLEQLLRSKKIIVKGALDRFRDFIFIPYQICEKAASIIL